MQDNQLLTQYAQNNSETAFSQIIGRHLPLVYRTCRRELGSDTLAEDAAQVVFLLLARKAKALRAGPSLAGWLYQTAVFVAKDVRKQEARRIRREEAVMQETVHAQTAPAPEWDTVEPLLNAALSALKPADRDAVLLRFFEGHTLAETGTLLGVTEDAARMRCARALEKLRRYLTAHGAAVPGVVLAVLLTTEAARPLPADAASAISQRTLQALSTAPTANVLLLSKGVSHTMKIIKIKYAALAATVLVGGASVPPLAHALTSHKPGIKTLASPLLLAETRAQAAGTQTILLQHIVSGDIVKSRHWDQPADLPVGVTKIQAVPAQNALAVTATPAGFARVQEIVKSLDVEPRQVQIKIAFAHASEADLKASAIKFGLVPLNQAGAKPVLVRSAIGSAAASLLQTLTERSVVTEEPEITTANYVSATINISTDLSQGKSEVHQVGVMPRVNSDNSVTLFLHLIFHVGKDNQEINTIRTIGSGNTLIIVMPRTAPQIAGDNLLLFVTPTIK